MQVSLEYAYPALAAVEGETGKDPQDIQRMQSRIPGAFDEMRGNIDQLSGAIQKDPSTATLLDSVVAAQLQDKSMSAQDRQQVTAWLKSQREGKEHAQQWGSLASGGLFIASLVPALQEVAIPLRVIGAGLGGVTMASEIPDLMLLDAAAQSGLGCAGKLTSQSPEQARFNLVMGYANVGLAGLDMGLEVGVVQKLARIPSLVRSAASLTREQSRVLVAGLSRIKGEVTEAVVQKMAQAVKGADNLTTSTIVNADGTLTQSRPLGKVADSLDATVAARASGKAKKPPKLFEEYANAARVKSFIGAKVDPNNLPPGYLYGKVPLENGKFREVIYMASSDGTKVPLKLDAKGFIKMADEGEYRIVNSGAYTKNIQTIPGKSGKLLGKDSQIHHLIPDNVMREQEIFQEALRRGIYNPDRTSNLIEMANKSVSDEALNAIKTKNSNAQLPNIRHYSSHDKYDLLVEDLIRKETNGRDVRQLSDGELHRILDKTENQLRDGFLGKNKKIQEDLPVNEDGRLVRTESNSREEFA
jgi:hypothetical protein